MSDTSDPPAGTDNPARPEQATPPAADGLLNILFNSMGEGAGFVDPQERFVFANPAAEHIFDVPPGALVGRSLLEFLEPDQAEIVAAETGRRRQGESNTYELAILNTGGVRRWLLVTATPHYDAGGQYLGAVGVFRDITERKQIEAVQAFLAEQSWITAGEDLFHTLARYLAMHLQMDAVGIARLVDQGRSVQTLASYYDGEFQPNFIQVLKDTPNGEAVGKTICSFPTSACDLFPNDELLQQMQAESYLGATLWNSKAEPIGLIAMASRSPLRLAHPLELILQMVAVRAAGELERMQAEEALRQSEERLRGVVNNAYDGISIVDPDGRVIEWNSAMENITGIPAGQALGAFIWEIQTPLMPPNQRTPQSLDRMKASSLEALRQGQAYWVNNRLEWPFHRRDGAIRFAEQSVFPFKTAHGYLLCSAVRDITEQKMAETALRASEARYRLLAENMTDVIWTTDEALRFTYISPSILRLRGLTQAEALQETIPQTLTPHSLAIFAEINQHRLAEEATAGAGAINQIELEQVRKDGSTVWVEIVVQAIFDELGRKTGYLGVSRDISVRKQADQVLREYAAEQELLSAVTSVAVAWLDQAELLPRILEVLVARLQPTIAWIYVEDPSPALAASRPLSLNARQRLIDFHRNCTTCANALAVELNDACFLDLLQDPLLQVELDLAPHPAAAAGPGASLQASIGCIPLFAGERLLGRLSLVWRTASPLSDKTQATLVAVGRQIAIALHNVTLFQTARQADRLQTLNQISATITSSLDLNLVLEKVLQTLSQATSASGASILHLIPETGELIFEATLAHEAATLVGQKLAPGVGLSGWIVQHRQSINISDVQVDPRYFPGLETLTHLPVRSLIGAPLLFKGDVKGVIQLINKNQGEFSGDDLALLEAVASIAAVALENARLFDAARSRADEMATIHQISQTLSASLDSTVILNATVNQLYSLLGADFAGYFPVDPMTGKFFFDKTLGGQDPGRFGSQAVSQDSIANWIIQNGRSLLIGCAAEDERLRLWADRFPEVAQGTFIFAPLVQQIRSPEENSTQVTGCLCAMRYQPNPYSLDDLHILESIASVLNVALKNAELYEDLQHALDERERTQNQLVQSEKVSALGRLAASLAHEINNPLQAVKGFLSLLKEEIEEQHNAPQLEEYLRIVRSEIERVVTLVRSMREFYRPSNLQVQKVDLSTVLEQVLMLSAKQLNLNAITVETRLSPDAPAVIANLDHLKQVFINLILNASDAMQTGGTLRITADRLLPTNGQEQPSVIIHFSDTGQGIAPQDLDHIFEPFYTTKESGSGLGLYISYTIIQSYGGNLSVTSRETEGSTFTIVLPAAPESV